MRALPNTDEAIRATLEKLWHNTGLNLPWRAGNTVATGPFFGAFVCHANSHWFEREQTFEHETNRTTVDDIVRQLRKHERELASV